MHELGEIHQVRYKYAEAEGYFTQALMIYTNIGFDVGRANALRGLGEVRLREGRYAEAKLLRNDAAKISDRISDEEGTIGSKKLLAEVLEAEKSHQATRGHSRTIPQHGD